MEYESTRNKPVVALLAAPETSASVLYGLYDVLNSVGAVYPDMVMGSPGSELLDVRIVTADGKPLQCIGNIPVEPDCALNELQTPDAIVVCDMYIAIYDNPKGRNPREVNWLSQMHRQGVLVTSVCSGSLLLAEAGLLDGHRATVHWAYRDMFQRYYPDVEITIESVLCLAAEKDRIITSGGVNSWHDLSIYLIARFCGYQTAIETAKVFLINGHAEGQSPYAVMTRPMDSNDKPIADSLAWVTENYAVENPVENMVAISGLNARTFGRRFRGATGYTPIEYIQSIRVEEARRLLENGNLPVDDIGDKVGYKDSASFRRVFKRNVGLSPAAYRKKYQQISQYAQPASMN